MRKVVFRGFGARRLRLALTALSVALGVTLIAGTYVFTDTINRSFDRIFTESNKGTDAAVTPHETLSTDMGTLPTVPASTLRKVLAQPGVAEAEGGIFDQFGTILDKHGDRIGAQGAPNFIASLHAVERFEAFQYVEGRKPKTPDEVALDRSTARREGFKLGDKLAVQGDAPRKDFTIVGITRIAGVDSFGGAAVASMVLPEAQRMSGKRGVYDEIEVAAKPGVSPDALKRELRAALPRSVDVRTGTEQAAKESQDIRDDLGFLQIALLVFAGISLFVGAFIIFNTFSITVTQRIREFALLRTLGASRRQILQSVVGESVALGVVGSLVGLGLGIVLAPGLRALFKAFEIDLPSNGNVILTRTIVVSLLVGTIVTIVAGLAPAIRATRVPPIAALREGVALPRTRGSRFVTPLATLLTVAGIAAMAVGLLVSMDGGTAVALVGGGAGAVFLGVGLLSPRLVRPLASVVGAPIERIYGVTGRLARENTTRQPGRTAATAAALMIGLALVTFVSIFAASARETIAQAVDTGLKGEFVLQHTDGFSPISREAARAVAREPGVGKVAAVRFSEAKIKGVSGDKTVSSIDPETFPDLYKTTTPLPRLDGRTVALKKGFAEDEGFKAGDRLHITTPVGKHVALTVAGIVEDKGHLTGDLTITNDVAAAKFGETHDAFAIAGLEAGADSKQVQSAITAMLKRDFPQAEVLTAKEFKDNQADQINQVLMLIYALLSLAIIVSLFGIVNTLVLSIHERTRELGMLRAIGTSRRQVRRVIRYEGVITSLIGGLLGSGLGVVLAVLVSQPIDDFILSIPVLTLVLMLVLAGVAGVFAAVLPARRASRLDVLEALAYE